MKYSLPQKITFLITLALISFSINSCISGVGSKVSSQVQIGLKVNSLGDTLSVGGDSLRVTEIQLVHGLSFFIKEQDTLFTNDTPLPLRYVSAGTNPQALLSSIFREGTYSQFDFKISQAPAGGDNVNPQFYPGNKRLSMIVKGTYNGSAFTFQSQANFVAPFPFNPAINISKFNDNYIFIISTDTKDWFLKSGGQSLYDPDNASNTQAINDNIAASFTLSQDHS